MKNFTKNRSKILLGIFTISLIITPVTTFAGKYKDCAGHSRVKCWWGDTRIKVFGILIKEADGHSHPGIEACLRDKK